MRIHTHFGIPLAATALFCLAAPIEARALMVAGPPKPGQLAIQADIILLGKVAEVEKDTVEVTAFRGAPKDQKMTYKIAVVKMEESILGGKGLTQFRVGFPAEAGAAGAGPAVPGGPGVRPVRIARPGIGFGPVALTVGQEGVFFLTSHHSGDFYVLASNGTAPVLTKKDENYAKELEEVKKVIKTIEDPVAALKAKELADRFSAAQLLVQRYQTPPPSGVAKREPIPAEENKLLIALLRELPWEPSDAKPRLSSGPVPPCRSAIWNMINPAEFGFKQPKPAAQQGGQPVDYNKVMDEATTAFLKEDAEKIKIKRYAK